MKRKFLKPLRVETQPGVFCQQVSRPIDAVGLYIPGGSAPLLLNSDDVGDYRPVLPVVAK